jgi:hypothetical protein
VSWSAAAFSPASDIARDGDDDDDDDARAGDVVDAVFKTSRVDRRQLCRESSSKNNTVRPSRPR